MIYKPFSPLTLIQNRESVALTTAALSTLPALAIGLFSPWLGLTTPIWALFSVALLTGAIASAVATLLWRLREEFLLECNSGSSKEENVVESSLDAEEPEKEELSEEGEEKILPFQQHLERHQEQQQREQWHKETESKTLALQKREQEIESAQKVLEEKKKEEEEQILLLMEEVEQQKKRLQEEQERLAQEKNTLLEREQKVDALESLVQELQTQIRDQRYEIRALLQINAMEEAGSNK